jgi:hypothetical protein
MMASHTVLHVAHKFAYSLEHLVTQHQLYFGGRQSYVESEADRISLLDAEIQTELQ